MKYYIPAAVAIGTGLLVLLSYLLPIPELYVIRLALVDWAVVLAGLAVIVGVLNVLLVHTRRFETRDRGWGYSLLTVVTVLLTLFAGMLEGFSTGGSGLYEPGGIANLLFNGVIAASLAALAAVVMVVLVAAAVRMLRTRPGGWSILFLATVVVVLVGWIPLAAAGPLNGVWRWLITVPAAAGARGILLGTALGTLVIGLRVLTGGERPYKG
jgi:hypothetical protein